MATNPLPYVHRRKRRDGTVAFRGYCDVPGSQRQYSETFDTERDAYDAALRMRGEVANTSAAETLDEAIDALLTEARQKRTRGTVRWYADHLRAVCRLIPGETYLHAISAATIEEFVRERLRPAEGKRKVKPATVNADLRALHRVFAVAIRRSIVKENPVQRVDRPRADAPAMDWFTDAELREVLAKVRDEHARDVLTLFAMTGVRRSEAARLEPGHVRLKLGQLVVPGKNATRVVPIAPGLAAPLKRLLAASKNGLLVGTVHAIDDVFREAREAVGDRRMHAHCLRHTFCTALIRSGVRPDVVMRLAGHRSIQTTLRYLHECGDEGASAVALLRLVPPDESAATEQA